MKHIILAVSDEWEPGRCVVCPIRECRCESQAECPLNEADEAIKVGKAIKVGGHTPMEIFAKEVGQ